VRELSADQVHPDVPRATVEALRDRAAASPARCGSVRVVCVDGPAGSGKTTLARALGVELAAPVVTLDDLYEGWEQTLGERLACRIEAWLLVPWRAGLPGRHLVYDWEEARFVMWRNVTPGPVVIIEGCGSASARLRAWASLTIWVDAAPALRRSRGIARDGEHLASHWSDWQVNEERHFADDGTRSSADVHVDGVSGAIIGP
jgi:uridine kinase